jgi:hypothetical protein
MFFNVQFRLIDSHLMFYASWFLMKPRSQGKENVAVLENEGAELYGPLLRFCSSTPARAHVMIRLV